MILESEQSGNNNNYNTGMDYSPIVAINKVDMHKVYFDKNI